VKSLAYDLNSLFSGGSQNDLAESGGFELSPSCQSLRINEIVNKSRYWSGFRASLHMSDDTRWYRLVTAKIGEKCSQTLTPTEGKEHTKK
jgi:hypothetical protein